MLGQSGGLQGTALQMKHLSNLQTGLLYFFVEKKYQTLQSLRSDNLPQGMHFDCSLLYNRFTSAPFGLCLKQGKCVSDSVHLWHWSDGQIYQTFRTSKQRLQLWKCMFLCLGPEAKLQQTCYIDSTMSCACSTFPSLLGLLASWGLLGLLASVC